MIRFQTEAAQQVIIRIPLLLLPVPRGNMCKIHALKLTNDDLTSELQADIVLLYMRSEADSININASGLRDKWK